MNGNGTNGRGSFGDALLAMAGAMLAGDVARARKNADQGYAPGDRLIGGDGTTDKITAVRDGKIVAVREKLGTLPETYPLGFEFEIPDHVVETAVGLGVSRHDTSGRVKQHDAITVDGLAAGQVYRDKVGDTTVLRKWVAGDIPMVEFKCSSPSCIGHVVSAAQFVDHQNRFDAKLVNPAHPHPAVAPPELQEAKPAADPIAEVAALATDARASVLAASAHRVSVDAFKLGQLLGAVERLSAGKVAKPATLHKPSAAANQVEAHTAVEAAAPAPSDPIAQAMGLIPNTYVEDENNICAAISNMVNDLDRFRRQVAAANENARKAEGRANDAMKRATQAEENLLTCRVKIESLERETRTFPAHVPPTQS